MFKASKTCILGLMVTIFLMTGCKSPLTGTGPYDPTKDNVGPGQRYYVGKDIILVTATITKKTVPTITDDFRLDKDIYTTSVVDINKQVVPDYSQYYMINLDAGALYDDTITVSTNSDGLITSFDSDVTGKTGEVIQNIGKIATNLLAMSAGLPKRTDLPKLNHDCIGAAYKLGLDKKHQYFANNNAQGCQILKGLIELREESNTLYTTIYKIRKRMAETTNEKALAKLQKVLDAQVARLKKTTAEITTNNTLYEALFGIFEEKNLTVKTVPSTFNQTFEISEVPKDSDIVPLILGQNSEKIINELKTSYPKMANLFEKTNALFTQKSLTPTDPTPTKDQIEKKIEPKMKYLSNDPVNFPENKKMPKNRIYFRQTIPHYISQYHLKNSSEKKNSATLNHKESKIKSLMHPDSPIQFIEYNTSKFAKRQLTLTFDPNSNVLTGIKTTNTSSAVAATGGLATAISAMPEEYKTALGNIKDAQTYLKDIAVFEYTQKINELAKKKALIDAQVAFEGAQATESLLVEKALIDQELSNLQSELAFKKAEATFAQELGLTKISADLTQLSKQLEYAKKELTYENQLEVEKLKTLIQSLTKDLEELKNR